MHYEIDPDKSHLEEIGVGLYRRRGFGKGYDKEVVSWKGALRASSGYLVLDKAIWSASFICMSAMCQKEIL